MSSRRKRLGAECTSKTRHDDLFVCGPTVNKLTLSYSRAPIGHNDARFLLLMNSSPHPRLLVLLLLFLCGLLFLGGLLVRLLLCVCLSRTHSPSLLCACPPLSLSPSRILLLLSLLVTLFCVCVSLCLCVCLSCCLCVCLSLCLCASLLLLLVCLLVTLSLSPKGVPQGQTESGGIVHGAICWAMSAQRRDRRTRYVGCRV